MQEVDPLHKEHVGRIETCLILMFCLYDQVEYSDIQLSIVSYLYCAASYHQATSPLLYSAFYM